MIREREMATQCRDAPFDSWTTTEAIPKALAKLCQNLHSFKSEQKKRGGKERKERWTFWKRKGIDELKHAGSRQTDMS